MAGELNAALRREMARQARSPEFLKKLHNFLRANAPRGMFGLYRGGLHYALSDKERAFGNFASAFVQAHQQSGNYGLEGHHFGLQALDFGTVRHSLRPLDSKTGG